MEKTMEKLKLSTLEDDKPVKISVELPAAVHRDLVAYAQVLGRDLGQGTPDPAKLIPPMLARFMATDRVFAKRRKNQPAP
jgi:hypothetical protein